MTHGRLERTEYDRPSFYNENPATRALGHVFAIMDRHLTEEHLGATSVAWEYFQCGLCGFDARAEYQELYPEEMRDVRAATAKPDPC